MKQFYQQKAEELINTYLWDLIIKMPCNWVHKTGNYSAIVQEQFILNWCQIILENVPEITNLDTAVETLRDYVLTEFRKEYNVESTNWDYVDGYTYVLKPIFKSNTINHGNIANQDDTNSLRSGETDAEQLEIMRA